MKFDAKPESNTKRTILAPLAAALLLGRINSAQAQQMSKL
jgi:hypothetical protein